MEFIPESLYSQAETLYLQGYSCLRIEQILGLNRKKVSAYLKKRGIKVKVIAGNHNKQNIQEKYIRGEEMFLKGNSIRSISKELKISRAGFSYWLKQRDHEISMKGNFELKISDQKTLQAEALFIKHNSVLKAAKEAKVGYYALRKYLENKGYKTDIKNFYKVNEIAFEKIDTSEKAYWLGMLYAEAYVNSFKSVLEFTLKKEDKTHVVKFKNFLDAENPIKTKKIKNKNGKEYLASTLKIYRKKIVKDLISLGCIENKSLILTFPDYSIVPKHLMRDFTRGYFDGDGCISLSSRRKGRECSVAFVGTVEFLDGIRKEMDLPKKKYQTEGNAFSLKYDGVDIPLNILNYMYRDAEVYLERKYNLYRQFLKNRDKVESNKLKLQKKKDDKYQLAATLLAENKSIREISSLLKISRQNLSYWFRRNGYDVSLSRPLTDDEKERRNEKEEQVINMYRMGCSLSQIRKSVRMNFYSIREIIKKSDNGRYTPD